MSRNASSSATVASSVSSSAAATSGTSSGATAASGSNPVGLEVLGIPGRDFLREALTSCR